MADLFSTNPPQLRVHTRPRFREDFQRPGFLGARSQPALAGKHDGFPPLPPFATLSTDDLFGHKDLPNPVRNWRLLNLGWVRTNNLA